MIEKIARTLARRRNQVHLNIDADDGWNEFLFEAEAVLDVVKIPTDAMAAKAGIDPKIAKDIYGSMLNEASAPTAFELRHQDAA